MPLIPIVAYSFASTLKLKDLVPLFGAGEARVEKDRLLATLPGNASYVIAYDFGALVLLYLVWEIATFMGTFPFTLGHGSLCVSSGRWRTPTIGAS